MAITQGHTIRLSFLDGEDEIAFFEFKSSTNNVEFSGVQNPNSITVASFEDQIDAIDEFIRNVVRWLHPSFNQRVSTYKDMLEKKINQNSLDQEIRINNTKVRDASYDHTTKLITFKPVQGMEIDWKDFLFLQETRLEFLGEIRRF